MNQQDGIPEKIVLPKDFIEIIAREHQGRRSNQRILYDKAKGVPLFEIEKLKEQLAFFDATILDGKYSGVIKKSIDTYKRALATRKDEFYIHTDGGHKMSFVDLLTKFGFRNVPEYQDMTFEEVIKKKRITWAQLEYNESYPHPFALADVTALANVLTKEVAKEQDDLAADPYLRNILTKYAVIFIPQYESETTININDAISIRLINTREEKEYDWNRGTIEEQVHDDELADRSTNSIRDLLDSVKKILITAEAGAGKTTFLRWVTHHLADIALLSEDGNKTLPVYIELKNYRGNLKEKIVETFSNYGLEITTFDLKKLGDRLVFILDGLDELPDKSLDASFLQDLKSLVEAVPQAKYLLSTRDVPYSLKNFIKKEGYTEIQLKKLTDKQIRDFVRKYLTEDETDQFLNELADKKLTNEIANPLMLTLIISRYKSVISRHKSGGGSTDTFDSNGLLFRSVIGDYFSEYWEWTEHDRKEAWEKNIYKEDILNSMQLLANQMLINDRVLNSLDKNVATEAITPYFIASHKITEEKASDISKYILERLMEANLLVKEGNLISFWIRPFRDYFAAEYLFSQFKEVASEEPSIMKFVEQYSVEKWIDAFALFIGLLDAPEIMIMAYLLKGKHGLILKVRTVNKLTIVAKTIRSNKKISNDLKGEIAQHIITIIQRWNGTLWEHISNTVYSVAEHFRYRFFRHRQQLEHSASLESIPRYTGTQEAFNYYISQTRRNFEDAFDEIQDFPVNEMTVNSLLDICLVDGTYHEAVARHLSYYFNSHVAAALLRFLEGDDRRKLICIYFFSRANQPLEFGKEHYADYLKEVAEKMMQVYLDTKNQKVRDAVLTTYYWFSDYDKYATMHLLKKFNDENWQIRKLAIDGLPIPVKINVDEVIFPVIGFFKRNDNTEEMVQKAMRILSFQPLMDSIYKQEVTELITPYLTSDNEHLRKLSSQLLVEKI